MVSFNSEYLNPFGMIKGPQFVSLCNNIINNIFIKKERYEKHEILKIKNLGFILSVVNSNNKYLG